MAALTLAQALDRASVGEPIAPVCQIQWIDAQGNPTPACNPAVARVRCKAYDNASRSYAPLHAVGMVQHLR